MHLALAHGCRNQATEGRIVAHASVAPNAGAIIRQYDLTIGVHEVTYPVYLIDGDDDD
jgi:hypothetical protein